MLKVYCVVGGCGVKQDAYSVYCKDHTEELFRLSEEPTKGRKQMTNFNDVSVGDRVRLTHEVAGTVEFEVRYQEAAYLTNGLNSYFKADGWTVEILERAAEKLPTGQYAVVGPVGEGTEGFIPYFRMDGKWGEVDLSGKLLIGCDEEEVKYMIREHGFEVLYEGIQ